jgi:hypothetical protein
MALHIRTTLNEITIDFSDFKVHMEYEQNNYNINLKFADWLISKFQMVGNQFNYGLYQAQPNFLDLQYF